MNQQSKSNLDVALNHFVATTQPSKIAVIVPLYGYWSDSDNGLGAETLLASMDRINSSTHQIYTIIVADPNKITKPVADVIISKAQAGNTKCIPVPSGACYSEYIKEGIAYAQDETDARFFVIVNPWVMLQDYSIDKLIDRLNRGDSAKIICGFDVHAKIDSYDFLGYSVMAPKEQREINSDLMGFDRLSLEMLNIDGLLKTKSFMEFDIWQTMFSKGFDVITSEALPIFSFDLDWSLIENAGMVEEDRQKFINKWGFNPVD